LYQLTIIYFFKNINVQILYTQTENKSNKSEQADSVHLLRKSAQGSAATREDADAHQDRGGSADPDT